MTTKALRILVVDDNHDTVTALQRILVQDGYDVTTAERFDEALVTAQGERFDVLVCDLGLPEHDGYDLLAKIKAVYPIRSVAFTGHGLPEDVQRVSEAGFDDFLLKPVDMERLRSVLNNLAVQIDLSRTRGSQAPASVLAINYQSPWHIS